MDASTAAPAMLRHFRDMTDPRRPNTTHRLTDLFTIALFAVLAGAEAWVDVAAYGHRKRAWLSTFLDLRRGIPSHDTFGRVFARLVPAEFERCFTAWMSSVVALSGGKLVAIDGKSLRRSFAHGWDKSGMAHLVSAFACANRMVFAQVACDGKGRELDAIERLLALLDLNGAVVTIDALGCNANIAQKILDAGGRYVLQVKDNQPTLLAKLKATMDDAILDGFAGMSHDASAQGPDDDDDRGDGGAHGRVESRRVWVTWDVGLLRRPGGAVAGPAEPGRRRADARGRRRRPGQRRAALLHYRAEPADQGPGDGRPPARALGHREQPALATGRQLPRGRAADSRGPRGGELQPPVPDRAEPAQGRDNQQARHGRQAKMLRLGRPVPANRARQVSWG
jgi:hypothetical protein